MNKEKSMIFNSSTINIDEQCIINAYYVLLIGSEKQLNIAIDTIRPQ